MYEVIDKGGVLVVRLPHPTKTYTYPRLANVVYEETYGIRVTRGHCIVHKDGDYRNCAPENLLLMSTSCMRRYRRLMENADCKELQELILAIVLLIEKINNIKLGVARVSYFSRFESKVKDKYDIAVKQRNQERYRANSEEVCARSSARLRANRLDHPEEVRAYERAQWHKRKEKANAQRRQWRKDHPDEAKAKRRDWNAAHREEVRAYSKAYRDKKKAEKEAANG